MPSKSFMKGVCRSHQDADISWCDVLNSGIVVSKQAASMRNSFLSCRFLLQLLVKEREGPRCLRYWEARICLFGPSQVQIFTRQGV